MKQKVQVWIYRKAPSGIEVLLLLTNAKRGSFWQPITGKVETGETLLAAAAREATEETGIDFGSRHPTKLSYEFSYRDERSSSEIHETGFALEESSDEIVLDPKEHAAFEWLSVENAMGLLKFESNRLMLSALVEHLGRSSG